MRRHRMPHALHTVAQSTSRQAGELVVPHEVQALQEAPGRLVGADAGPRAVPGDDTVSMAGESGALRETATKRDEDEGRRAVTGSR